MSGGNFWEGAATGFVVSLLNHYAHEMGDGIDPPKKGTTSDGKFYGGDGSGSASDIFSRFVYETDQWNPIALAWDGLKGYYNGSDRYGNLLTNSESGLKLSTSIPIGKYGNLGFKSINQLNKLVLKGTTPKTIVRFDKGKIFGELDHVHFSNGAALNVNGTWKHGNKMLTNQETKFLNSNGWKLPKQ